MPENPPCDLLSWYLGPTPGQDQMPAPRKYGTAQRQEMYRLFLAGKKPVEISRLCEAGTAGTEPFKVPRRTVAEIVTSMAADAEQAVPTTVADVASVDAVDRFPERIATILKAEIDRLEAKQTRGPLSVKDLECLDRAERISGALAKRINRRRATASRGPSPTSDGDPESGEGEGLFERLAREEAESRVAENQPSRTHTRLREPDPDSQPAADAVATQPAEQVYPPSTPCERSPIPTASSPPR